MLTSLNERVSSIMFAESIGLLVRSFSHLSSLFIGFRSRNRCLLPL